jgi:hypothetical protein
VKIRARGANPMDFCRGIAELAAAVRDAREPTLTARWSLHVTELVLAMQNPERLGSPRRLSTRFAPLRIPSRPLRTV